MATLLYSVGGWSVGCWTTDAAAAANFLHTTGLDIWRGGVIPGTLVSLNAAAAVNGIERYFVQRMSHISKATQLPGTKFSPGTACSPQYLYCPWCYGVKSRQSTER